MTDFPWLTTLCALPLVGALVVALLPRQRSAAAKPVALAFALLTLAVAGAVAVQFEPDGGFQLTEQRPWIPAFGASYALGVDGIALVLIALTAILTPVVMLASWRDTDPVPAAAGPRLGGERGYFGLMLLLESMVLVAFAATDVFLFYVFFEAMLIPMYFLIGRYGGPQRSYAAAKFLIYNLLGGLVMLAAVIGLYVASTRAGEGTFLFSALADLDIDPTTQKWLFAGFFIAFAVKAPLWPLHTWLPDAAAEATPGNAVLMVSVMDKAGTFGMLRYCLPLFPEAARSFTPLIITLAVVSIVYGALVAIGQVDIKRLIGYTSVSHFGFIVLGIFAMTTPGQSGATLYMVNHGFSTAALFLVAGYLITRRGSRLIGDYGGVQQVAPVLAGTFLLAGLSSLALPGLSSFVSEFLVLAGTFARYEAAAVVATVGIILAAVYILWLYQRTMHGPLTPGSERMTDLRGREIAALAPLLALIIALGFFPKPVLDVITPAVARTMEQVGRTDPGHLIPLAEGTSR